MYPEFAYTGQMQFLLGITSFASTFISLYLVAELILTLCGVRASLLQRLIFAFITGTLLHSVWTYGIYFLGGRHSFEPLAYTLIISPNPLMAALYYLVAIKLFRLSPIRSIKVVGYVYLYWVLNTTLWQLLGNVFFPQTEARYNYMLSAIQTALMCVLFYMATKLLLHYIRKNHAKLEFVDNGLFYWKRDFIFFLCRKSFVYALCVLTPLFIPDAMVSSIALNTFLIMFIAINLLTDMHSYDKQVIGSQQVHISALFKGMEEFRGIRHDFSNVLHTYNGYLELGEYEKLHAFHALIMEGTSHTSTLSELSQYTSENPALVSLLMDKLTYAEKSSVKLSISIKCAIDDFFISPVDFCRVLSCLFDNAVEAAARSEGRRIYFTCENQDPNTKLVILTNTISSVGARSRTYTPRSPQVSQATGQRGNGLNIVRNTLGKYGNCTFRVRSFNQEFSAYIELQRGVHAEQAGPEKAMVSPRERAG